MTSRISILPKRRLLATAVALIVTGGACEVSAQAAPTQGESRANAPVAAETCPLGSFVCPPRPVSYALCRPNAMLDFYDPSITKDTSLRETSITDITSNINATTGVKVETPEPNLYHLTSGVRLVRADQVMQAEDATYNADSTAYDAKGNVRYQEAGMLLRADRITGTTTPNQGDAYNVQYQLLQSRGNGVADHAKVLDPQHGRFTDATYSTCDVGSRQWEFRAKKMNLNKETGVGEARSATMRYRGVPFMYLPYFTFPLDDRRKSGFLYPTFGSSTRSGTFLNLPYYLNLAPNYDATITPGYYSDRGPMLGGEFRYLLPRSNGTVDFQYMAHDKGPDDDESGTSDRDGSTRRWLLQLTNSTTIAKGWNFSANINRVSDNQYFRDFSNDLYSSAIGLLSSSAYVSTGGKYWSAAIGADDYQNVDAGLNNYVEPYRRWPRATFNLEAPVNSWLDAGIDSEAVAFRKTDRAPFDRVNGRGQVDGNRIDLAPYLAADFSGASWFVRPRVEYRYTGYRLDSDYRTFNYTKQSPSRSVPITSVDAGLIFDRQTSLFGNSYTQTLEPRLYYLYVPYRNQDDLPAFDTNVMSFDFWQLFSTNRFSGADRQQDANNLTAALTTRLLDDNGVERLSASIGQIKYFSDQRVQMFGTPQTDFERSDYVAQLGVQFNDKWRLNSSYQWNPNKVQSPLLNSRNQVFYQGRDTDLATVQVQRRIKGDGILNFSYRYRRNVMEQFDTSVVYPVSERWRALARWVFARRDVLPNQFGNGTFTYSHRTLEAAAGIEYNSCCVAIRVLGRHYVHDYLRATDNAIMFEVEFKGVGSLNPQSGQYLRRAILGYQ
ncbi:LPS assembly protein LptD [Luteibacter sp. 3190]|uniref:LPS-assembly protein LptD n=1 Tax=Luteibacter sp. 3190 TaxID=2817736 RepID=UPI00285E228E|nr:LPS assembly protein LptD [Luteibacter sp. 3190]MDR6936987.1 LPS-assembly protein [Luteibacter sp. 3190]